MITISPIQTKILLNNKKTNFIPFKSDEVRFEHPNFDKKPLIERGIIDKNTNINSFFDDVSKKIFSNENKQKKFSNYLKEAKISLSSSCYSDLNNPKSAVGLVLNPNNSKAKNILLLEEQIKNGFGIGVNLNDFDNPADVVVEFNKYFNYRQNALKRPPAGIALLDIHHPKILDFITLKNNCNYNDWCFDLSVILDDDFFKKLEEQDKNTKKIYDELLNSILNSGEPGIIFSNDKNYLCDCCAASKLNPNEALILGHINLSKFYNNGKIDYDDLKIASEVLSKGMLNIDKNARIGILGYQDLLNKMNLNYGSGDALLVLDNCLKIISKIVKENNLKSAISPTGTISRFLKTTPSIEPDKRADNAVDYNKIIKTLSISQKYIEGNISNTIQLKNDATIDDVDEIIKLSKQNNLKAITMFKPILQ